MSSFYFSKFQNRQAPEYYSAGRIRIAIWKFLAILMVLAGLHYFLWRWGWSINFKALWYSLPLLLAETLAFGGTVLTIINYWDINDPQIEDAPKYITDCVSLEQPKEMNIEHRILSVDIFITTYSEDPELVRLSIIDCKNIIYPYDINLHISVLDDGKREEMRIVSLEEGVSYISRNDNVGFKAGNLRNAMEQTSGDFILICDADTRPFPDLLKNCLGYFRDPDVAWVQTPQWFYDIDSGKRVPTILKDFFGRKALRVGRFFEKVFGKKKFGSDPFGSDPTIFYNIIQRRRNRDYGSFCCGASSIHRREAIMEVAIKSIADRIDKKTKVAAKKLHEKELDPEVLAQMRHNFVLDFDIRPYQFHVSEDIFTSITLHSDGQRTWKSVFHPEVLSKMLSPQDFLSWTIQNFKYAGGTLDLFLNHKTIFKSGMSFLKKVFYFSTFYSFLGGVWNFILLLSPIVFLFTDVLPVKVMNLSFLYHFLPYIVLNNIAFRVTMKGHSRFKSSAMYIGIFPLHIKALFRAFRKKEIKFIVTPKIAQGGSYLHLVWPQIVIVLLYFVGVIFYLSLYLMGHRDNLTAFLVTTFWVFYNTVFLLPIIRAAGWKSKN